jgi:hypothetical protein
LPKKAANALVNDTRLDSAAAEKAAGCASSSDTDDREAGGASCRDADPTREACKR